MKKIVTLLLTVLLFLLSCSSCNYNDSPKTQSIIFKEEWLNPENVTISLQSGWDVGYDFILTPNKKLITIKGRITPNYSAGDPVEIIEYAEKDLTDDEWKDLLYIKNHLGDYEGEIFWATDVRYVILNINDEEYGYIYGMAKNEMYDIFVVKIIHYSAIEVVNSKGVPVTPYSLDLLSFFNFGNYYETESEEA